MALINELIDLTSDLKEIDLSLFEKSIDYLEKLSQSDQYLYLTNICQDNNIIHPEWGLLAGRIRMHQLKKTVPETFSESTSLMKVILNENYFNFVMNNSEELNSIIVPSRDYDYNIFSTESFIKSYLARIKKDGKSEIVETPQYLYLRVATFIWYPNFDRVKRMYESLSTGEYIHASPTLFNSGMFRHALSSCFLLSVSDNMQSIAKSWHDCAIISMNSGGIGIDFSSLRHSEIGNHGFSRGIIPWAKVLNAVLKSVDQCFAPETIVYTKFGPKMIQNVTTGDKLIRSNGEFHRVLRPIHYKLTNNTVMYSINTTFHNEDIQVADCHPVLSISGTPLDILRRMNNQTLTSVYTEVKNLNENCYIGIPVPSYEKDYSHYTMEDCRMYGILLGNSFAFEKKNDFILKVKKEVDYRENSTYDFVREYLQCKGIQFTEEKFSFNRGEVIIRWSGGPTFSFTREMVSEGGVKRIHPSFLHLPSKKVLEMLYGICETSQCTNNLDCTDIYVNSKALIEGLRYILLRLGLRLKVRKNNGGEYMVSMQNHMIDNLVEGYNEEVAVDRIRNNCFFYDGKLWTRVISVNTVKNPKYQFIVDLEMERTKEDVEETANYLTCLGQVHNGGRRAGSGTVYLCPWHIDVEEFLDLKKATGAEDMRARDLFYALWVSDEFMRRVYNDQMWTLLCPNKAKGLETKWGVEFEMLYKSYEAKCDEGKITAFRRVKARDLWEKIILSQIETGMPFILYKDAINRKCNQKNLGTIRCSNLCTEITEYTDDKNIASCNLANISLNCCVNKDKTYDFSKLERITSDIVHNLNNVIDRNFYPSDIPEIKETNMKTRPLGIGVQGLADTFAMMDIVWESEEAKKLNNDIFETMYYSAINTSMELSKIHGKYELFEGSPASKGFLQFDLWDMEKITKDYEGGQTNINSDFMKSIKRYESERYDWRKLRQDVKNHGLRNSLLTSLMPTAGSANITGNTEAFEVPTKLIYARSTLSGQFVIINKHMVKDFQEIDMWKTEVVRAIISDMGSIQQLSEEYCPNEHIERFRFLKNKYKTAYEVSQRHLLDMSADRGKFICQTQSMNCWMGEPTYKKLNAYHFHGWKIGLKTGMYYLRQSPKTNPINFSLNTINIPRKDRNKVVCNDEICLSCQ